jgi:hypothetical protein
MVHVGLHSVGTYHKSLVGKNILWRVSKEGTRHRMLCRVSDAGHLAQNALPSVIRRTLGKDNSRQIQTAADGPLPSAAICQVYFYAESPALGKRLICRMPDKKHSAKSRIPIVVGEVAARGIRGGVGG